MNCPCEIGDLLLEPLKSRLDITWDDPQTDTKLKLMLEDGAVYLAERIGKETDFSAPGDARALLFEYVRYARDQALDVFENNYRHMLIAAQDKRRIAYYEE